MKKTIQKVADKVKKTTKKATKSVEKFVVEFPNWKTKEFDNKEQAENYARITGGKLK